VVLDGLAEGFSPAFLVGGAANCHRQRRSLPLWLLTLEGVDDEGPTLAERHGSCRRQGCRMPSTWMVAAPPVW
jgi:hypothetical protein